MANLWDQNDVGAQTGDAASAANAWRQRQAMQQNVNNKDAHGSSAWLTPAEAEQAGLLRNLPITMGRLITGQSVGYNAEPHILTFAPTGAGKGVGVVIPNQTYPGSLLAVDPKGSLPAITARYRRDVLRQKVYTLDPWGISGQPSAAINPFDILDPEDEDVLDDAQLLADSLVIGETGKNQYFSDNARLVVRSLLLHLITSSPKEYRTVPNLLDMAFRTGEGWEKVLAGMDQNGALGGVVRRAANTMRDFPEETAGSIFTTVRRSLAFLESPKLQRVLSHSDFSFRDLKRSRITVYLVLPPERLESYARWLRLMLGLAILECGRENYDTNPRVQFLLDEFAALGRMELIETAIGLMRGYGIRFWPILQDYPQLLRLYEKSAGTFVANSGVIQAFNINDIETARFISERLGKETRHITENNTRPHEVNSSQMIGRDLLMPDEVMRLGDDKQLLLYKGLKPLQAQKIYYFKDPAFQNLFDRDPFRR